MFLHEDYVTLYRCLTINMESIAGYEHDFVCWISSFN